MKDKETKYRNTRQNALDYMASMLPDFLGGSVVKAKKKHKERLEKFEKKEKKDDDDK